MLTREQLERLWRYGLGALDAEPVPDEDVLVLIGTLEEDDEDVAPDLPSLEEWEKLGAGR